MLEKEKQKKPQFKTFNKNVKIKYNLLIFTLNSKDMGTITINKKEAIKKRDSIIAKTYNEKNVNDAFKKAFGMWAKKNIDSTKVRELAWLRK